MSFFNLNGFQSPPRSRPLIIPSPTSPFSTSPSQLQEVTLDQDYTFSNSMGLRSPSGPMRGKSVKEFEEQLSSLKKENFNLKLRIYFLEERMGVNFNLDKENIVKKNVELMVEVESLRKEVQEKHDLLCQAVKAMELEDEEHKKLLSDKDDAIAECQQEIEGLKSQLIDLKAETDLLTAKSSQSSPTSGPTEFYSTQAVNVENSSAYRSLQEKIRALEEELSQEKQSTAAIQIILDQNDAKIKSLSFELEESRKSVMQAESERLQVSERLIESLSKCQDLEKKLKEKEHMLSDFNPEVEELRKRHAHLASDLEKERKRYEKLKLSSEHKIAELQSKLEGSLSELKKSQELVVSKSPGRRFGNTDADSFSVQKPTTPLGSPQKDTLLLPAVPSPVTSPVSSPSPSVNGGLDLQHLVERMKTERDLQHQKIVKLKAEQMKACKIIKSMIDSRNKTNEELAALRAINQQLEAMLDERAREGRDARKDVSGAGGVDSENSMEKSGESVEHYKGLADELDKKTRAFKRVIQEKETEIKNLKAHYQQIEEALQDRDERIVDLEYELSTGKSDKSKKEIVDCFNLLKEKDYEIVQLKLKLEGIEEIKEKIHQLQAELEEKDELLKSKEEEIEFLNLKLQKRNCDLQGLVNNELWEKNREIEKLQNRHIQEREIEKLKKDLNTKEKQLNIIKEKISELGIEVHLGSGDVNVQNKIASELEKSEKLRMESNELVTILSRRLEELAMFLDSLLEQRTILGFLGKRENKKLRDIINQSLDLSKTITKHMITNPDQSLLELTNITSILNDTKSLSFSKIDNLDDSFSCKIHLSQIRNLQKELSELKLEMTKRDEELRTVIGNDDFADKEAEQAHLDPEILILKNQDDQFSESEAWSEPDLDVSRARIGLLDGSLKSNNTKNSKSSTEYSEEEDRSTSQSRRSTSANRATIKKLVKEVERLEQKLSEETVAYDNLFKENVNLRRDLDARITEAEEGTEKLRKENEKLRQLVADNEKELQDKIRNLEDERDQALQITRDAVEATKTTKENLAVAEARLKELEEQMNAMKSYDEVLQEKMQAVEEEYLEKMTEIQDAATLEIKNLHSTIQQLQDEFSVNYVKKCKLEEASAEVQRLKNNLHTLEEQIMEAHRENEEYKSSLKENESRINVLRNDLDQATLQYSEAVLDKTKMANEKARLEQELSRCLLKEVDFKKSLDQMENEMCDLKQKHQRQLSALQLEKSTLEVRVSELESSNAELHNKLIKIQAGYDHVTGSLRDSPNFVNQIVSFRRQHSENSGYNSEEHILLEDMRVRDRTMGRSANQNFVDVERHEANSSPDLGIESDHGRFSSLETPLNIQRPLLQTLELTESMNNLLDDENNVEAVGCDNAHCCQKTVEMAHENSELKRKLLRTRRALEETVTQLTLANQRKKQVEKTICKQIHKTSQVLRKAKANLDSGSETDMCKQ